MYFDGLLIHFDRRPKCLGGAPNWFDRSSNDFVERTKYLWDTPNDFGDASIGFWQASKYFDITPRPEFGEGSTIFQLYCGFGVRRWVCPLTSPIKALPSVGYPVSFGWRGFHCQLSSVTPIKSKRSSLAKRAFVGLSGLKRLAAIGGFHNSSLR